jgi:short-subunit dehydrogenase
VARSTEALEALATELNSQREGACSVEVVDLTQLSALSAWAEGLEDRYGPLNGVIHNAGVDDFQPSEQMSPEALEAQVALNLTAPLLINRALLPAMLARDEGVFIHLSSVAGYFPTPFGSIYSGTKAGLWLYNEALAIEYAHTRLAFVTLHPAFVNGVGMHERHKEKAGRAPWVLGGTTAEAVVETLTRALLKKERLKSGAIIINRSPLRPVILLFHTLPRLTRWLFSKLVRPYLERVAR